ncbi:MAG TPA: hypothetical protein VN805_15730 [Caulobacteraceae bacterium]|nr:hypothetical protein [Caulobacteraceae bacterium]
MIRLILAAAALLLLAGCNMVNCDGAAAPGYGAADCGIHTTFLAAAATHARPRPLAKS